jgi:hypothetical protein
MKKLRIYLQLFCFLWLGLVTPLQRTATAPSPETYKQNTDGLAKQFEPFLKAYEKNDDKRMDESFGIFGFPKPKEWFEKYFSAADAEQLSASYGEQVNGAESLLIHDMNVVSPGVRFKVRCELRGEASKGQPGSEEGWIRAVKQVPVEQFQLEFRSTTVSQKFSFIANFVYLDGAYRYVGWDAAPFWAKPKAVR